MTGDPLGELSFDFVIISITEQQCMHILLANRIAQMYSLAIANSYTYIIVRLNLFTTSGGQVSRKLVFCVQYSASVVETWTLLLSDSIFHTDIILIKLLWDVMDYSFTNRNYGMWLGKKVIQYSKVMSFNFVDC